MPQAFFRTLLLFLAVVGVAAPAQARLIGVAIGVSQYSDARLTRAALPGAAIDAEAVDAALKAHGAAAADTTMLTGADATAPAIRAAISHLVATAGAGDRVVIYVSGHGAQIPARRGDPEEPDGLDEMFLAADAAPWNAATHILPGAVKDDEFGAWIDQLRAKGASVWFVVDACNGGGLARGGAQDAT
ncbi:MAG: caspase family protein, partial [Sphingomonas sp.]